MFILLKTKNNKKIISKLLFSPKKYCSFTYYTFCVGFLRSNNNHNNKKREKKRKKRKRKRETRNVDVSSAIQTLPKFHILFFSFHFCRRPLLQISLCLYPSRFSCHILFYSFLSPMDHGHASLFSLFSLTRG